MLALGNRLITFVAFLYRMAMQRELMHFVCKLVVLH